MYNIEYNIKLMQYDIIYDIEYIIYILYNI